MKRHLPAPARLVALLLVELAAAGLILRAVRSVGSTPWDHGMSHWLTGQDPLDVAAQIAGAVALVILAYLLVVTIVHLVAVCATHTCATRSLGLFLTRLATKTGPRWITSLAVTAAFAGIGITGCSAPAPQRAPATMVLETPTTAADADAAPVTMSLEGSPVPDGAPPLQDTAATDQATADHATPPEPVMSDPPRTVEVLQNESLWSIAEREASTRLGRTAVGSEVRPYWLILIEVNRSRLVDPSDPDRIYAGQVLVLP